MSAKDTAWIHEATLNGLGLLFKEVEFTHRGLQRRVSNHSLKEGDANDPTSDCLVKVAGLVM